MTKKQNTTWQGEWEYAVFALYDMVAGSVNTTIRHLLRLLANNFEDHPINTLLRKQGDVANLTRLLRLGDTSDLTTADGELAMYAAIITIELLHKPNTAIASPASPHPEPYAAHWLARWQPTARSLRVFIAEAVRSSASKDLKTSAFRSGMLYPLLQDDFGIRVDFAEFKVCHSETCNGGLIAKSVSNGIPVKLSDVDHGIYEGHRCPVCHTPADPQRTYMLARRNWLIVPYDYGGRYELQARWHCRHCGTLFPISSSYVQVAQHIQQIESYIAQVRDPAMSVIVLQTLSHIYQMSPDYTTARNRLQHEYTATRMMLQHIKDTTQYPLCHQRNLSQRPTYVWVLRRSTTGSEVDSVNEEYP